MVGVAFVIVVIGVLLFCSLKPTAKPVTDWELWAEDQQKVLQGTMSGKELERNLVKGKYSQKTTGDFRSHGQRTDR